MDKKTANSCASVTMFKPSWSLFLFSTTKFQILSRPGPADINTVDKIMTYSNYQGNLSFTFRVVHLQSSPEGRFSEELKPLLSSLNNFKKKI